MSLYLHSGHRRGCHCLSSSAYRSWSWHLSLGGVCLPLSPLPHCPSSYLWRLMVGDWTEMNEKHLVNFTLLCTCQLLGVITSFLFPTVVGTGTWVFHHFCIHKECQDGTFYGFLVRNCWLIQVPSTKDKWGNQSTILAKQEGQQCPWELAPWLTWSLSRTLCPLPPSFILSFSLPSWFLSLPQSHSFPQGNGKTEP